MSIFSILSIKQSLENLYGFQEFLRQKMCFVWVCWTYYSSRKDSFGTSASFTWKTLWVQADSGVSLTAQTCQWSPELKHVLPLSLSPSTSFLHSFFVSLLLFVPMPLQQHFSCLLHNEIDNKHQIVKGFVHLTSKISSFEYLGEDCSDLEVKCIQNPRGGENHRPQEAKHSSWEL